MELYLLNGRRLPLATIVCHVEKHFDCKDGDTPVSGKMPTLPIERGKPGLGSLAHPMVAKCDDHIPLYLLSEICDWIGIDIFRSVIGDWMRGASVLHEQRRWSSSDVITSIRRFAI